MTTRPGGLVHDELRYNRGKRVCHLARITRQDGYVLRFTDHDRKLTFENEVFQPIILAGLSADRREAALRSGNQEARGAIDGSVVTIPDLLGNKYRGAMVEQIITDWERPWCVIARHRKWIRSLTWTGSAWVGTLEGRTHLLQRDSAGELGGAWSTPCTKVLGAIGPGLCNKLIEVGTTNFAGGAARVATIVRQKQQVTFTTASWGNGSPAYTDDFFRDGSFEWIWAAPEFESVVTATTTATTLTDSTQTWTVNEHVDKYVRILNGTAGGLKQGTSFGVILSNTATQLTYASNTYMNGHGAGTYYDVCGAAANYGILLPIVRYVHSTRDVTLLLPTPFPIAVGDSGIWRAGCDGLRTTCRDKFDNILNHGGDPFAPSAQQIVEPPEEV